ncbi:MAG: FHA domain-containing protein [Oscillospiraceae bacterium]|nr:FHA domain-containing protein [Oscillospiraceae bacterium]
MKTKNEQQGKSPGRSSGKAPVIRVLTGPMEGQEFDLNDGELILGRGEDCSIRFPADARGVSARHCSVRWNRQDGSFTVRDLESTHGVYLDTGMKLEKTRPYRMKPGETLYLGSKEHSVLLTFSGPAEAAAAAAAGAAVPVKKGFPVLPVVIAAVIVLGLVLFFVLRSGKDDTKTDENTEPAETAAVTEPVTGTDDTEPGAEPDEENPAETPAPEETETPQPSPTPTPTPTPTPKPSKPAEENEEPPELDQTGASIGAGDYDGGGGGGTPGGGGG